MQRLTAPLTEFRPSPATRRRSNQRLSTKTLTRDSSTEIIQRYGDVMVKDPKLRLERPWCLVIRLRVHTPSHSHLHTMLAGNSLDTAQRDDDDDSRSRDLSEESKTKRENTHGRLWSKLESGRRAFSSLPQPRPPPLPCTCTPSPRAFTDDGYHHRVTPTRTSNLARVPLSPCKLAGEAHPSCVRPSERTDDFIPKMQTDGSYGVDSFVGVGISEQLPAVLRWPSPPGYGGRKCARAGRWTLWVGRHPSFLAQ